MDGKTLMAAMTYPGYAAPLPLARYTQLAEPCEIALKQAGCGTVARAAMFLAQIGAESGSLRWTQELASGQAYDRYLNPSGPWRALGNTARGDGVRFKGRSFIQITGRHHYAALSSGLTARATSQPRPTSSTTRRNSPPTATRSWAPSTTGPSPAT
jgi:predicted chitinase